MLNILTSIAADSFLDKGNPQYLNFIFDLSIIERVTDVCYNKIDDEECGQNNN
jgi:hypothetical protein